MKTPDAQALAQALAFAEGGAGGADWWLLDATAALEWVAATLHAEGDVGDALRERLGLTWVGGGWVPQSNVSLGYVTGGITKTRTHRRLTGAWEPLP